MNNKNIYSLKSNKLIYTFAVFILALIMSLNSLPVFAIDGDYTIEPPQIDYKEVLIFSSQTENNIWESQILNELNSSLLDSNPSIHIITESLSTINTDESYLEKQAEIWSLKYKHTKFDLIIALDDESLNFIGNHYSSELFANTPIVYGGINDTPKLSLYPYNTFTGVIKPINIRMLINSILEINPKASEINILLDNTISSKYIESIFMESYPYYDNRLKFNFVKSDYIYEICDNLSKNNIGSPSIIVGSFIDSSDISVSPHNAVNIMKNFSKGQFYTTNESYIGAGVIGGHVLLAKDHSKIISEICVRVLNGVSPKEIPSVYDFSNTFVFDAKELTANNISKSHVPENSIFVNDKWLDKGVSTSIVISLITILVLCIVLLVIQVTKRIKNARAMISAKKRYNELLVSDKIKTEFLANFSHEIRTLLNVILSGLQLLDVYKDNGKLTFANKDDEIKLVYIRRNGYRLLKLINNLIDMTKVDSGFYSVDFEVKNIVDVVEDITMSVVQYAADRGITIVFDTNNEEVYMPLDSEKLDRILLNLISNAIKFTPKGGYIYVTLSCQETSISVSVKDTGIGISKDKQTDIFERFTQVKNSKTRHKQGSGIGLSLVKSLVELLDGSIMLTSEPNEGCEFVFTLPIKEYDKATTDVSTDISEKIGDNREKLLIEFSDIDSYLNM